MVARPNSPAPNEKGAPDAKVLAFASLASASVNNDPANIDTSPTAPTGTIYDGINAVVPQAEVADAVYDEYAPTKFFETSTGLLQASSSDLQVEQVESSSYLFNLTKADAGYKNVISIFKVDDEFGNIQKDDGSWLLVKGPGDPDANPPRVFDPGAYRTAARGRSQVVFSEGENKKLVPGEKLVTIPDDWDYFSYYLHQDGNNTLTHQDDTRHYWFAFSDVNVGGYEHFRFTDGNIEAEDLSPNVANPKDYEGDGDHNDAVFNFTAISLDAKFYRNGSGAEFDPKAGDNAIVWNLDRDEDNTETDPVIETTYKLLDYMKDETQTHAQSLNKNDDELVRMDINVNVWLKDAQNQPEEGQWKVDFTASKVRLYYEDSSNGNQMTELTSGQWITTTPDQNGKFSTVYIEAIDKSASLKDITIDPHVREVGGIDSLNEENELTSIIGDLSLTGVKPVQVLYDVPMIIDKT